MKPVFELTMLAKTLSRCLYPVWCSVCGTYLALTEDHVCRECFLEFHELRAPICSRCSDEMPPYGEGPGLVCPRCKKRRFAFDEVFSVYRYDDALRRALHEIKFHRKSWLLETFEKKIARIFEEKTWKNPPSLILPVPLDPLRKKERTFNQSRLIARTVSKQLDIPVQEGILTRKHAKNPQSFLSRKERFMNLEGSFRITNAGAVRGKWILLVDDVVTTGATAQECAKIIKEAGARGVSVFSLARTPSPS
ncbi:MAG: ComF family protein [Candidatus Omnitrophica bacterium]|nr:ComF family protein [Candidatus Omnitrophota bacterium]